MADSLPPEICFIDLFFYPAKKRNNFSFQEQWPYCSLPLPPSNANNVTSNFELRCILRTCIRRIADIQQQHLSPSHGTSSLTIQWMCTRLCNVLKCRRYRINLFLWTWKRSSLDENLSQNRGTGPIGCKLVISYAKTFQFHWTKTCHKTVKHLCSFPLTSKRSHWVQIGN